MSIDNAELLTRVELLMLALHPFAEIGTALPRTDDDPDEKVVAIVTDKAGRIMTLTNGDFRTATDALAELMTVRHTLVGVVVDENVIYLATQMKDKTKE